MAVCYRHPSRETGVSCSSCGRPICPDCMTPTPVGMRCPECARERTKVKTIRSAGRQSAPIVTQVADRDQRDRVPGRDRDRRAARRWWRRVGLYPRRPRRPVHLTRTTSTTGCSRPASCTTGCCTSCSTWCSCTSSGSSLEPAIGHLNFGVVYFVSLLAGSFGALLFQPRRLHGRSVGRVLRGCSAR